MPTGKPVTLLVLSFWLRYCCSRLSASARSTMGQSAPSESGTCNMARAGVVKHPSQWPWCGYGEWTGLRGRYRVVNQKECLELCGAADVSAFWVHYEHLIQERLARDLAREPQWTESIAVGSRGFVEEIALTISCRQQLERAPGEGSAWVLRGCLGAAAGALEAEDRG